MKSLLLIIFIFANLYSSDSFNKLQLGQEIFEETCMVCHGGNGDGMINQKYNLIVNPRVLNRSLLDEEQIYKIIKKGAHYWGAYADIMPSFENVYNEEYLRAISFYVHKRYYNSEIEDEIKKLLKGTNNFTKDQQNKMIEVGQEAYNNDCAICHGISGHGDGELTIDPALKIYPYDLTKSFLKDDQIFLYLKYGAKYWGGAKYEMPAWSGKYDDYTLRSVVKYIREVLR